LRQCEGRRRRICGRDRRQWYDELTALIELERAEVRRLARLGVVGDAPLDVEADL
jgi:hypothetical protein